MNSVKERKIPLGEGTVYQLDNGNWKIEFFYKTESNGERKRKTFTRKTKKLVKKARQDFLTLDESIQSTNTLVVDLLDKWTYEIEYPIHIQKGNAESSFIRRESIQRTHIIPYLKVLTIEDLTEDNLNKYVFNRLRTQDNKGNYVYSASNFKKVYDELNNFCKWCVRKKYLSFNPMEDIIRVTEKTNPPKIIEYLTIDEMKRFTNVCLSFNKSKIQAILGKFKDKSINISTNDKSRVEIENITLWGILQCDSLTLNDFEYRYGLSHIIQYEIGVRAGELVALNWNDVHIDDNDSKNNHVIIKNTIVTNVKRDKVNPRIIEEKAFKTKLETNLTIGTKTESGNNRYIPLSNLATTCFKIIKQCQLTEFGKLPEYVLTTRSNNRLSIRYYDTSLKKILKACNIDKSGTHILRHTFATNLFSKGVNSSIIASLMGHSSARITEDIYIQILPELRVRAIEQLNEIHKLDTTSLL